MPSSVIAGMFKPIFCVHDCCGGSWVEMNCAGSAIMMNGRSGMNVHKSRTSLEYILEQNFFFKTSIVLVTG